jgi:Putative lumazine-binding
MDDRNAITACISDYYDGYFQGDAERMKRCLHPELVKRSVNPSVQPGGLRTLSAADMVGGTADGGGRDLPGDDRTWAVESLDVRGDIAAAVVTSVPFVDYVHLGRFGTGWQIVNVLWANR